MPAGFGLRAALRRESRAGFDRWERFALSRAGTTLMLAWAFAEATVWPVMPDFLLLPMAAVNRRHFYVPLAASVAGAALGGIVVFLVAYWAPGPTSTLLAQLPLVQESQIDAVHARLDADGAAAFLAQPWSGIQFKVWGIVGGVQRIDPWFAIPAFIASRALRMSVGATLAWILGRTFSGVVREFFVLLAALYLALFFYGWWRVMF